MEEFSINTSYKNELILWPPEKRQGSEIVPSRIVTGEIFLLHMQLLLPPLPYWVPPQYKSWFQFQVPACDPFSLPLTPVTRPFCIHMPPLLILWLIFHLFNSFPNFQDCFCTSRTQVESLRPEKQSETSFHQNLVRKWLSTINTPPLPSVIPFTPGSLISLLLYRVFYYFFSLYSCYSQGL